MKIDTGVHLKPLSSAILAAIRAYFGGDVAIRMDQLVISIAALINVACIFHLKTGKPVENLISLVRDLHVPRVKE